MRLLVAAISFAVTLGAILAVDKLGSPKNPADEMAAILASAQKTQEIQLSPTATPKTVRKNTAGAATAAPASPVSTISPTPIPSSIAGADETTTTPITSMLVSAAPVPTTATPAPTAIPLATFSPTPTLTLTPAPGSHIYYTSQLAYPRSKYIYCDTDNNWKSLVNPLSYSNLNDALAAFPSKTLHAPCK
ncbi:MAG: hypothetical protein ABR875_00400 [Minisyncoccia bacterium]